MAQTKGSKASFMRMENDSVDTAIKILHHAALLLQEANGMQKFGEAVSYSARPWVLLFCRSMETMETAILACIQEPTGHPRIDRKVLESIRLCRVRNTQELRIILAGMHLKPAPGTTTNDLITWMAREKHGQPPTLIAVTDLLELLLASDNWFDPATVPRRRHLYVRYDRLADTLALLTETCIYLNNHATETWERSFGGDPTTRCTALLVTDHGCLQPDLANQQEGATGTGRDAGGDNGLVLETLHRIIEHYLGTVV